MTDIKHMSLSQRRKLAQEISSEKKGKAYNSAMRRLQLYQKGQRKPGKVFKQKFENWQKKERRNKYGVENDELTVSFTGTLEVSNDSRKRTVEFILQDEEIDTFLEALEKEDSIALAEVMCETYGIPYGHISDYQFNF